MKNMRILLALIAILTGLSASAADLQGWHRKVDPYMQKVQAQPDWLVSRLQMYWTTHATEVYVRGEKFDHVGGTAAPVPTVKLNGSRNIDGTYHRPKLEQVVPYDDDSLASVTFFSPEGKQQRVHPSKTGTAIASINHEILSIATAAARIYQSTGDTTYAAMAAPIFRTFMDGIYYRNVPIDLNHGHMQTLVSYTTFEVIHEDALADCATLYGLLRNYLNAADCPSYEAALKKWAENIIANGVPHNNWDLFQAVFITDVALVLQSNDHYADHKGREYYIDYVLHQNSIRQWSLSKLCGFGFDPETAIWYESPGYSTTVLGDLSQFANLLDEKMGHDVFSELPIIKRAMFASPQYLFPNRMIAGFGDTHPNYINTKGMKALRHYAERHDNCELRDSVDRLLSAVDAKAPDTLVSHYVSPCFSAPNVSWLMQRTGMDSQHDLALSLNGSLGNHQHANGISMELYGKGYVLGPDAGIGMQLYSGDDYKEYYSQFPAHNTVCVDGISSYPVMMSSHGFKVRKRYPATNDVQPFVPVTYSEVEFIEPESQSRQVRTNATVKTSATGGYYVDIFRSRKMEGGDKTHDYFYHNLGQTMTVTAADGSALNMQPTDSLAFAGGHLYAYSYLYNKVSAETTKDIHATFTTTLKDGSQIDMNLWMKGDSQRTIYQALSPVNLEYERMPNQPYDILHQPELTYISRQQGEAWAHPFVAIYEPTTTTEPSEIASVTYFTPKSKDPNAIGICVTLKSGRKDYIFSSAEGAKMSYRKHTIKNGFGVITE